MAQFVSSIRQYLTRVNLIVGLGFTLVGAVLGIVAVFSLGQLLEWEYSILKAWVGILIGIVSGFSLACYLTGKPDVDDDDIDASVDVDPEDEEDEDDIVVEKDSPRTPVPAPAPAAVPFIHNEARGGSGKWAIGLSGVALVAALAAGYFSYSASDEISGFSEQLATKANAATLSDEVASLNSRVDGMASQSSVDGLKESTERLNDRVVTAEETVVMYGNGITSAQQMAYEAKKLAKTMESRLVQASEQDTARETRTGLALKAVRAKLEEHGKWIGGLQGREHDTAVRIHNLEASQAMQDSMITAFRAELNLSDKDMARLAEKIKKGKEKRVERKRPPTIPIQ